MTTPKNPYPSDRESVPGERTPVRTLSATVRSMQVGQHLITALLIVVSAGRALADGSPVALILASSLVFAGWYLGGVVLASRTRDRILGAWWLMGLAMIWIGTVAASVEFVWLAFSLWLLAGLLLRWRWAVVFSIVVFAVVTAAPILHSGSTTYANIIGPLVGGLFALGISRGYLEVLRDSKERQRLVVSLVQAQEEMAELHEELARTQHESGVIEERTRLSRDIHDTIAQGFSSISLLARAELENQPASDSARVLRHIESLAKENLIDVRRIVAALAPTELEGGALAGALRRMLDRLTEDTGVDTELHVDERFPALPTAVEVALLRTAQSALANVRLHADAKRVVVNLADVEDAIRLDIADDGHGFDVTAWDTGSTRVELGGYGLHSMRARLRELGGGLDVESTPGEGTALSAHAPFGRRTMEDR